MPVYEYVCKDCNKNFETVQSVNEHESKKTKCPHCGSKQIERVYSNVYAITSKKS